MLYSLRGDVELTEEKRPHRAQRRFLELNDKYPARNTEHTPDEMTPSGKDDPSRVQVKVRGGSPSTASQVALARPPSATPSQKLERP